MATEITTSELIDAAAAPQSVTVDGQTVSERSVEQLIKADQYASAKTALAGTNSNGGPRSAWGRTRAAVAVPPGGGP